MNEPNPARPPDQLADNAMPAEDLTGQNRIVGNVLASWAAYPVFIVSGFILPRFIDRHLGQATLGVWDFCWSLVAYFGLVQLGVGTSVNRYIAKHRAAHDVLALRRAAASVNLVLVIAAMLIAALAVATSFFLPQLIAGRLAPFSADMQWVVLFLGAALATQIAFVVYNGTITGCHRWGLHNAINAASHGTSVLAMIACMALGGGLRSLAACYLCIVVLAEAVRAVVAHAVCPELSIRLHYARWPVAREMIAYGAKTFVPSLGNLLLNQTTSVLIAAHLGPAALALYARPRSLVRHTMTVVGKLAFVLTPTTSSLQAQDDERRIRDLLVNATRYAAYVALPPVLLLVVFGDVILEVWMGPSYGRGWVAPILAIGFLPAIVNQVVYSTLAGLNTHGRPGIARFAAAACAAISVWIALAWLRLGLEGTALALTLPLVLAEGFYVSIYACRRVSLPVGIYLRRAYRGPLGCALLYALCLVVARIAFPSRPALGLGCGILSGSVVLLVLYWKFALPERLQRRVASRVVGSLAAR